jgi:phospholipase C
MGYRTATEIPNYWSYAENYLLLDHMFEQARSWSWLTHLYDASLWAARCSSPTDPSTCVTTNNLPRPTGSTELPWVSLFQLFDSKGVSWRWYLGQGSTPDCNDDKADCPPRRQTNIVPSIWNPTRYFTYVKMEILKDPNYLNRHVPSIDQFYRDVNSCALPNVAWVVPSGTFSEHPTARITTGMEYVTAMVNAIMNGPSCNGVSTWENTVIFVTWDDCGGFYDHVLPPTADCIEGGDRPCRRHAALHENTRVGPSG